jgi:putative membrane protein
LEPAEKRKANATDYLANERTFLAWIRTGIAIMAFGFVIVKFGFAIDETGRAPITRHQHYSTIFGISLLVLGTLMTLLAFLRYRQVEKELTANNFKSSVLLSLLLTVCILFVGILLVMYLLSGN